MYLSQATLLSFALPLALVTVPSATSGDSTKTDESVRVVVPQEILEIAKLKRHFDQEDIPLVTSVLHHRGIDNFVLTIDPTSGDVGVNTNTKSTPHFDLKPGSCPNPIQIRGGAASTLPGGILGNGFDVTQTDLGTVRLQRPPPTAFLFDAQVVPIRIGFQDVGTPFDPKFPCECAALGPDGILDINVLFNKSDAVTILKLDHEVDGTFVPLQIVGLNTNANVMFGAVDCGLIQQR
jgi:hypothetical protein